ncbi:MAG TPA: pseudouridine synthase [Gaiellaceae bacterium]|nr:pseudouridine synthase [Gaiellaceae bacterium]
MPERLNRFLASTGLASRRAAEAYIREGRVTVNGAVAELGTRVSAGDDVRLDGEPLAKQHVAYVLLNKPAGVVTTARDPQGRRTVIDVVSHPARVVPVGRLDAETTGALLLTNDGELAHRLAHPRYEVDKVYEVECWSQPTDADLQRLREGVELDDGRTSPAAVRRLEGAHIELILHEGRNRQVRRMLEAVGHRVKRLHRSRYGPLTLEGLELGAWRELEAFEVERLRSMNAPARGSRPRGRGPR